VARVLTGRPRTGLSVAVGAHMARDLSGAATGSPSRKESLTPKGLTVGTDLALRDRTAGMP
jgi:hypothetical protein